MLIAASISARLYAGSCAAVVEGAAGRRMAESNVAADDELERACFRSRRNANGVRSRTVAVPSDVPASLQTRWHAAYPEDRCRATGLRAKPCVHMGTALAHPRETGSPLAANRLLQQPVRSPVERISVDRSLEVPAGVEMPRMSRRIGRPRTQWLNVKRLKSSRADGWVCHRDARTRCAGSPQLWAGGELSSALSASRCKFVCTAGESSETRSTRAGGSTARAFVTANPTIQRAISSRLRDRDAVLHAVRFSDVWMLSPAMVRPLTAMSGASDASKLNGDLRAGDSAAVHAPGLLEELASRSNSRRSNAPARRLASTIRSRRKVRGSSRR